MHTVGLLAVLVWFDLSFRNGVAVERYALTDSCTDTCGASSSRLNIGAATYTRWRYIVLRQSRPLVVLLVMTYGGVQEPTNQSINQSINHSYMGVWFQKVEQLKRVSVQVTLDFFSANPLKVRSPNQPWMTLNDYYALCFKTCSGVVNYLFSVSYPVCF